MKFWEFNFVNCRYVAMGKGILQSHHLTDELDGVDGEDEGMQKLKDDPFCQIWRCAQVIYIISQAINICIGLFYNGGNHF